MTEQKTYTGTIAIRGKGFGFVAIEDFLEDIFIPVEETSVALDRDTVEIRLTESTPDPKTKTLRKTGAVVRIIERAQTEFIGVVKKRDEDGSLYFSPDNHRVHVRPTLPRATEADLGMKVVVTLQDWTDASKPPIADITETLGKAGQHETEMQAIIRSGGFSEEFAPEIAQAAHELYENQATILADAEKDPKRRDMRGATTFTIDPADAKDFDDALSLEKLPNGNVQVGIHIADVSHYVEENGHIDQEARDRGTSIYLVDRVIPMLPEVLSNDLCSLRPNTDRLAFSAVFELTPDATIADAWYGQTLIHSDKRFTYEDAQTILTNNEGEYLDELTTMMSLARILRKKRFANGAIAFEQPEVKFELAADGTPIRAYTKERVETMLMIEDFMLLANREVATYINKLAKERNQDPAFIYRIHDVPDPERIEELALFVHALGYEFEVKNGVVKATDINKLLEAVEGKPEENLIKTATIRSMAKAVYTTKNIGHFGLAFKFYTHFTSPIRRYPDLMVHRMLRRHLDNSQISGKELSRYEKLASQSSEREGEAVRAERDSIKYKQVEYMLDKVGQEFTGIITGVTDWGMYVAEKESQAEGMIRIGNIGRDFYKHEKDKYRIKGERTGENYRLGDEIPIKLMRADLEEKQLDFELAKK